MPARGAVPRTEFKNRCDAYARKFFVGGIVMAIMFGLLSTLKNDALRHQLTISVTSLMHFSCGFSSAKA